MALLDGRGVQIWHCQQSSHLNSVVQYVIAGCIQMKRQKVNLNVPRPNVVWDESSNEKGPTLAKSRPRLWPENTHRPFFGNVKWLRPGHAVLLAVERH